MSQELDAPKMPTGTYPELSPNPNSEGLKLKDGGRGTPVVVNTEPKQANTNTITVNEVKRLIREAIDHFEKEEGGVTEEELNTALATKANKIGGLPYFEVKATDKVLDFLNNNGLIKTGKQRKNFACILINADYQFLAGFTTIGGGENPNLNFELEALGDGARYRYDGNMLYSIWHNFTFGDLIDVAFERNYLTESSLINYPKIFDFNEGRILTDLLWSSMKTGDILEVNHMQFIIDVFETTGEGAYKGVTGKMLGAVTSNSISIISLDWRTVGEGYTELEPTLTTITIPSAE